MVENIVAIELAYINTKHPDFHKEAALVPSLLKTDNDPYSQSRRTNTPRNNMSPQVSSHSSAAQNQQQSQAQLQTQQQQQQQQQNDSHDQVKKNLEG